MEFVIFLKKIWSGKCSKREYLFYYSSIFAIYLFGIIYAAIVYPGGFSFTEVYTSYLGGNPNNIPGYRVYNTCLMFTGLLAIPHFIFLYRKLTPSVKILSFLGCLCGVIGFIGFASLGIYYQGNDATGHQIATWIAFGGFGGSAIFLMFVFIWRIIKKYSWPKWGPFLGTYGQAFLLAGIMLGYPNAFTNALSEWIYILIVMIYLYGIILMTDH